MLSPKKVFGRDHDWVISTSSSGDSSPSLRLKGNGDGTVEGTADEAAEIKETADHGDPEAAEEVAEE